MDDEYKKDLCVDISHKFPNLASISFLGENAHSPKYKESH